MEWQVSWNSCQSCHIRLVEAISYNIFGLTESSQIVEDCTWWVGWQGWAKNQCTKWKGRCHFEWRCPLLVGHHIELPLELSGWQGSSPVDRNLENPVLNKMQIVNQKFVKTWKYRKFLLVDGSMDRLMDETVFKICPFSTSNCLIDINHNTAMK